MADTSKVQKGFETSAVGSDEYLTSLIRRLDVLEKKIVGQHGFREDQPPLKPTLEVRILCLEIMTNMIKLVISGGYVTLIVNASYE